MNSRSTYQVLVFCLSLGVSASQLLAADITVNWNEVHQTITGFGASIAEGGNHQPARAADWTFNLPEPGRTQAMDLLFDSTKGIGFNMCRTELSYFMQPEGGAFDVTKDNPSQVWFMQEALKRNKNVRFWPAPWTPPLWMKTVADYGNGSLATSHYQDYANYMSSYIRESKRVNGVDFYAISVQNEPHFNPAYGGCYYDGNMLRDYVKVLGATFRRDNVTAKIIIPETNFTVAHQAFATPSLSDPIAEPYVGICAFHVYEGAYPIPFPLADSKGKQMWETETSVGPWSGNGDQGFGWAVGWTKQIHQCLTNANCTAWHFFWFQSGGNGGLLDISNGAPAPAPRFWYVGHFSKFIRPGWVRLGTNVTQVNKNGAVVYVSAFKNPADNKFAIVAINEGISIPGPTISIQLNGISPTAVTPYVSTGDRSPNLAIAKQTDIPVTSGTFNLTLYNVGIATVTGNGPAVSVASPAPAAGLERSMRIETMRNGILLRTQRPGAYRAELLGVDGKRLASWNVTGPGNRIVTTSNFSTGLAVVKIAGAGVSETATVMIGKQ